jgi:AraC family transcriptional activator of tynA and feaB
MLQRGLLSTPELDYEQWREMLRPNWGLCASDDPERFSGRVRSRSICGFNAADVSNNIRHCERTQRDIRLDGVDHWYALFQMAGRSMIVQNDRAVTLAVGDVALIDSARPVTYVNDGNEQWLSLQLPRRALVAHLGFEPQGGVGGRRGTAGRLLHQLVCDAVQEEASTCAPASAYMKLAVYDLLGALFVAPDLTLVSSAADKLFKRICDIVRDRFTDPAFGPGEAAAEAGISLRYLQKLFTAHNATCSHFIQAVRLDHAARLVHRRQVLGTGQPFSEIAYACGFADYTNFARGFRRRFGHTPGSYNLTGRARPYG